MGSMTSWSVKRGGGFCWCFKILPGLLFSGHLKEAACPKAQILTDTLIPVQSESAGRVGWLLHPLKKLKWLNVGDDSAIHQPRCTVTLAPCGTKLQV